MKRFDDTFEGKCEEYLTYLYSLASREYGDCPEIDALVQDTLTIFIGKTRQAEKISCGRIFRGRFSYAFSDLFYFDKIRIAGLTVCHAAGDDELVACTKIHLLLCQLFCRIEQYLCGREFLAYHRRHTP